MGQIKITLAQKKQAVQIAISGGDPLKYLENLGSKRPDAAWYNIKEDLKKVDPETYAKIPDYRGKNRKSEARPATVKVDGPLRIETPEAGKVEVVETPELIPAIATPEGPKDAGKLIIETRYAVTAISYPDIGEFYFDRKYNSIDWRTIEGDEVSMSPTGWKILLSDLPEIFKILGVEL